VAKFNSMGNLLYFDREQLAKINKPSLDLVCLLKNFFPIIVNQGT
jgi:hypothetical protein